MSRVEHVQFNEGVYANDGDETQRQDPLDENQGITIQTSSHTKDDVENFPRCDAAGVKRYGVAVVSVGLLCVLLVIVVRLAAKHITETQKLQSEIKRLELNNDNLTQNEELLQAKITNLTWENEKLMNCADAWKCFGSSRYYISSEMKNWTDSQQHCIDLGAHLVIIDSLEEQKFVLAQQKIAWIGLSDLETEGVWKWVDGRVLNNSGLWMTGEPNNEDDSEDCVEIINAGDNPRRIWNDNICKRTRPYICEK